MEQSHWASTVILVDADYLDTVAADMIAHFGRMLGRAIEAADLCHWIDCACLDAGLHPGDNEVQVHFLHSKDKRSFAHLRPSLFDDDLNGLSFSDNLGRFNLFTFPVEEVVSLEEFYLQSFTMLADSKEVRHLVSVGDMRAYGEKLKDICEHTDGKDITLFAMEPQTGKGLDFQILGYSLMAALGIRAEEL